MALTKSLEVGSCFGSDVVEELDEHLLRSISVVDVELDVRSANSLVDGVLVGVVRLLLVDEVGRVVHVSKLLKSPLQEVLSVAQVSIFVRKIDNETALVLIEVALLLVLKLLQVLIPLSWEETNELKVGHSIGMLLFEEFGCRLALVQLR